MPWEISSCNAPSIGANFPYRKYCAPGKFNEHLPHVHFSPTRTHVFNEILYDTGFVRGKGTFELRPESNNLLRRRASHRVYAC